jgi:hypothetical protein
MKANSDGGCLCGAVRYRITGAPRSSSVCFCRSCRLAGGAASIAWIVLHIDQYAVVSGQPARFRSSPLVVRSFCATCGTPLSYQHADDPSVIELTTATLDEPQRFPPTREIWHSQRVPWAASNPTLSHLSQESQ